MNFILFTNQGFPLRNSSLGQLHSDGGVVSIVRSSAGMFLLEYLSARRLCCSGYYSKYQNGALSSGFWAGEINEVTGTDIRRIGRLRSHRNSFFCQKFIDGDYRVTWGVVVVQHPRACNASSHTCHPFPESFKDFPIKVWLTIFTGDTNSLWKMPWLSKQQITIDLILDLLIVAFLGRGEFAVCHSRLWRFVSGSYSKIHNSSPVITRLKNTGSLSRRYRRSRHTSLRLTFCSVVRFFETILAHTFLMSKSCDKMWWTVNRFKFNSVLIILSVNRRSDLKRDLTLSTLSSVF